jgi:hypothetical protein
MAVNKLSALTILLWNINEITNNTKELKLTPLHMVLPVFPTNPGVVLSIVKKHKNNKSPSHDHINNKTVKNLHLKPSFFSPTSLMLYFDYLISLPFGNQHSS